ncbi:MAG: BolA family transcriptional regulator [Betaproteobacteria bacterium]|nr:BolA family transcriptional regulator [Betaproteobacteria bacterium]
MTTVEKIRARLGALSPEKLDIVDESHKHAGHEGAKGGGGHYAVTIVSRVFEGKNTMARHRMVYGAVSDLMPREIHALSIRASAPGEI